MRWRLALCALLVPTSGNPAYGAKPNPVERARCLEGSGHYERAMFGRWACVIHYPDAGKVCTDDHQCLGGCIYELGQIGRTDPKKGDLANGICQRKNLEYGCSSHIKNGRVADDGLCAD